MTERAEGFWWVHYPGRWNMALVASHEPGGPLAVFPFGESECYPLDWPEFEQWGPYLGKEPGGLKVGDTVEIEGGERGVLVAIGPHESSERYKVWLGYGHARSRREVRRAGLSSDG